MSYKYNEVIEASIEYFNGNELAAKVFADKYALRNQEGELLEKTPREMHVRLAKEFARIEKKKFKNPLSFEDIFGYFDKFEYIIPQGSPMFGIGNDFQIVSLSNCFVVESPLDSYGSILKTDEELVQISKRRGGNGLSVENLRPSGSATNNAAKYSTGSISFCSRFSNTIREVAQSGRRGALLESHHIKHPDSVIPWDENKNGKPYTVKLSNKNIGDIEISSKYYDPNNIDFCTMKYDDSKVTGANVSIKLTDDFMKAVENNQSFQQQWPIYTENPKITRIINANDAYDKIIYSAWLTAEPGVLFWDTIIRESIPDCYKDFGFETISTNPCGEIPLSAYDSCRLLLLNTLSFVVNPFTEKAYFDYDKFYQYAQIAQRLMDDLVDLEEEAILKIINKIESDPEPDNIKNRELSLWKTILQRCREGRRTGTGLTAIGDTIAACNIKYGSEDGIKITDLIYKTLKLGCYRSSINMAKEIGPFPIWNHNLENNNPFLNRIKEESPELYADMQKYGRRNIACLTTAPAGSTSIVAKTIYRFGTSSGIEPQYSIKPYIRSKKGNPNDNNFKTDYIDQNGDHWQNFIIYPSAVLDWMDITKENDITKSPWYMNCAEDLDWKIRVRLQAAAQKHICHSISSTVNLPNDVTFEKVKEIYMTAWKYGCKGLTIYRDGCRTGVLKKLDNKTKEDLIPKKDALKRPKTIDGELYLTSIKGIQHFVVIGLYENKPYEVFAGIKNQPLKQGKCSITKVKRGLYTLTTSNGEVIDNISGHLTEEQETVTRLISLALRHNNNIEYVVHQLEKVSGEMTSLTKAISRCLKKYIKDGIQISGEECAECGGKMIRNNGCKSCPSCGASVCS